MRQTHDQIMFALGKLPSPSSGNPFQFFIVIFVFGSFGWLGWWVLSWTGLVPSPLDYSPSQTVVSSKHKPSSGRTMPAQSEKPSASLSDAALTPRELFVHQMIEENGFLLRYRPKSADGVPDGLYILTPGESAPVPDGTTIRLVSIGPENRSATFRVSNADDDWTFPIGTRYVFSHNGPIAQGGTPVAELQVLAVKQSEDSVGVFITKPG